MRFIMDGETVAGAEWVCSTRRRGPFLVSDGHGCHRRSKTTRDAVDRVDGSMIALPITATISPATAMSNAIIGLSSAAAAGHQCVRKTFEQRQFRQAVRIGASTNLLLPTLRRIGQVLDLVFRFGFRTSLREHRRGAAADRRTRTGADSGPQVRPAPPDVAPAGAGAGDAVLPCEEA
jgi:hypothetical protein